MNKFEQAESDYNKQYAPYDEIRHCEHCGTELFDYEEYCCKVPENDT